MNETQHETSMEDRPQSGRTFGCGRRLRRRGELGSQLVELAVIMPMLLAILLGAVEFAQLEYDSIEVSNAAYAGAAYGAQNHITAMDTSNMQLAAIADAATMTGVSATATSFCSCSDGTSITCSSSSSCVSPARILEYVQVNTSLTVTPAYHVPGLPSSYVLSGKAILTVEK